MAPAAQPIYATPATPLVMVVEREPRISDALRELCGFLRIRVVQIGGGAKLSQALAAERPICVMAHAPDTGREVSEALAAVARHDPSLPVLLVAGPAGGRDAVETAVSDRQAHPLSNVYWVDRQPGLKLLVEFLFMAERHGELPGMIPV